MSPPTALMRAGLRARPAPGGTACVFCGLTGALSRPVSTATGSLGFGRQTGKQPDRRTAWIARQQQKRAFGLPDLSKLAAGALKTAASAASGGKSSDVQTFEQSKDMPYTPDELYSIVADVDSYHLFLPYCTYSKVIGPDKSAGAHRNSEDGSQALLADLGVGFDQFQERYRSRVELLPGKRVTASALPDSNPIFTHLSTEWSFAPASTSSSPAGSAPSRGQAASTRIRFRLDYAFSNPMYALVAGQVFGKTSQMVMHAFEKRAAELYGR